MTLRPADLDRLEQLAREATPGPWRCVSITDRNDRWTVWDLAARTSLLVGGRTRFEADAAFMAAANPAVVSELVAAARLGAAGCHCGRPWAEHDVHYPDGLR